MVKKKDRDIASELSEPLAWDIATRSSRKLSSAKSRTTEYLFNDDIIVSLADEYENQRARQVTEWERRQHVAKTL